MKLRRLEMLLEQVRGYDRPDRAQEQYITPAPLAARLLFHAHGRGEITGRWVCDPGCGTGILACGAALLGAAGVVGIDLDPAAIERARANAELLGVDVTFRVGDIRTWDPGERFDIVVMNPPFGAQRAHADRPFIDFALRHAGVTYGVFNAQSRDFVAGYIGDRGRIEEVIDARFRIPRTFAHHRREALDIPVEIIRIRATP